MRSQPAVIFDLDGTLADSVPGITLSMVHALRELGHEVDDGLDLRPQIGLPMKQILPPCLSFTATSDSTRR